MPRARSRAAARRGDRRSRPTAPRFSSVSPKVGSARRARSTKRPIASAGSSWPTGNSCSRPIRSGARLVTMMRTSGPARSRSAWICAAAGIRCSKLSSTSRIDRPARNAWSRSSGVVCGDSTRLKVPAIASRTSSGSSIPSRRTSHAPSAKEAARRRAVSMARRVLPAPPGPVSVTSADSSSRRSSVSSSRSRPTKLVSRLGRFPTGPSAAASGGKSEGRPSITS